jgi:hypothetical protein
MSEIDDEPDVKGIGDPDIKSPFVYDVEDTIVCGILVCSRDSGEGRVIPMPILMERGNLFHVDVVGDFIADLQRVYDRVYTDYDRELEKIRKAAIKKGKLKP